MSPFLQTKKHQSIKGKKNTWQITSVTVSLAVLVLIFLAGIFYLVQINLTTTKNFQVKDLDRKIENLKETKKKLEIKSAGLRSTSLLVDKSEELGLVPVGKVDYLTIQDSTFAVK